MTPAALEVVDAACEFPVRRGLFGARQTLKAVNGVSLRIDKGQVYGLVGESGCGKSSLAKLILGLVSPTRGRVLVDGTDISALSRIEIGRCIQPIFQDPYSSLNPRQTIEQIVSLPLRVHRVCAASEWPGRVREVLDLVGLPARLADSYPSQLSGGQRQRVAIARAVIMKPRIIVCDEPTSALDVSVQSQILNLLQTLRREFGLTYLFISHNLAVVEYLADRVGVMYLGRIVEEGDAERMFEAPAHPYTRALLGSVLTVDRRAGFLDNAIGIDFPNPLSPPDGCAFHPRCPLVMDSCRRVTPAATTTRDGYIRCHLHTQAAPPISPTG